MRPSTGTRRSPCPTSTDSCCVLSFACGDGTRAARSGEPLVSGELSRSNASWVERWRQRLNRSHIPVIRVFDSAPGSGWVCLIVVVQLPSTGFNQFRPGRRPRPPRAVAAAERTWPSARPPAREELLRFLGPNWPTPRYAGWSARGLWVEGTPWVAARRGCCRAVERRPRCTVTCSCQYSGGDNGDRVARQIVQQTRWGAAVFRRMDHRWAPLSGRGPLLGYAGNDSAGAAAGCLPVIWWRT